MMRKTLWLALLAISACASPDRHHSDPVPMANKDPAAMLTWTELSARPLPPSGLRIAYGDGPEQFGELRLPASTGPHPVVVLIHGGCWLSDFDYRYMTHLGDALATQGYASWTIEYRRLGASGGGWPQTFTDVGLALDALRDIAATQPLDLGRIVTVGHSAGGQLALWLAARPRLAADSELRGPAPLPVRGVVGLAAITDLAEYRIGPPDSCHASVDPLLGGTPDTVPLRYTQTSPRALLPLGVPQWLIQGQRDPIVSADSVERFAQAARHAGDRSQTRLLDVGHFDVAAPDHEAWAALQSALTEALAGAPP